MSLDIQKHLKSYLPQLSEQALFAFYEFKDDVIPSFLSEGNRFSLLLFVRPDNWDSLAEK
ncbi:hypothetical protein EWM64_g6900 [Hericium alpestre]|uniref:Uncharacterized protein n=1 Tax=Hericium alpestre TaxID=135208 RepID=A0A4Y9ZQR1_9AGAM|nr:hypothetical protein EWM64_g6900 [Hericium alpestre]